MTQKPPDPQRRPESRPGFEQEPRARPREDDLLDQLRRAQDDEHRRDARDERRRQPVGVRPTPEEYAKLFRDAGLDGPERPPPGFGMPPGYPPFAPGYPPYPGPVFAVPQPGPYGNVNMPGPPYGAPGGQIPPMQGPYGPFWPGPAKMPEPPPPPPKPPEPPSPTQVWADVARGFAGPLLQVGAKLLTGTSTEAVRKQNAVLAEMRARIAGEALATAAELGTPTEKLLPYVEKYRAAVAVIVADRPDPEPVDIVWTDGDAPDAETPPAEEAAAASEESRPQATVTPEPERHPGLPSPTS